MELVKRICSVCQSDDFVEVFDQPTEVIVGISESGYHHKIQACRHCGFVFAGPLMPQEQILSYYEKMSNYEQPQYEGSRPPQEKRQIERYFDFIVKRFPPGFKGKALDVGCATAFGLGLFKAQGWDVVGVDPSQICVDLSKKLYDVEVKKGFFNIGLLQDEKPFDLIILCHVVEHLVEPNVVVNDLLKLLSDDGIVYIEVPNLLKPEAPKCYFCFEHVNYFTPTSLTNLMGVNHYASDELAVFDNGPLISPYYPVIASTWKKSAQEYQIENNFDEAAGVVQKFAADSRLLVSKIRARIEAILLETPADRLAVWGAGIHTSQLFSETILGSTTLACIFDNDPKKHGSQLSGQEIVKFVDNPSALKETVDAILISSEASEDIIYKQISHLGKHGIRVYRLYHGMREM